MPELYRKITTHWLDAQGKRCKAHARGARKVTLKSRKWYGTVHGKHTPLAEGKTEAKLLLNRLRGQAPATDHPSTPLATHLADYRAALLAKENTPHHVRQTVSRIQTCLRDTGTTTLAGLDLSTVNRWLASLRLPGVAKVPPEGQATFTTAEVAALLGRKPETVRDAVRRHGLDVTWKGRQMLLSRQVVQSLCEWDALGMGPEAVNHYVRALRSFTNWLADDAERLPSNPLRSLKVVNADTDRRHARRELETEELRHLLAVTRASVRTFRGLDGSARFHLYVCACGTGFRAGALAGLRPMDFDLAGEVPTVGLAVRRDKSRKGKVQPLGADVAAILATYLASRDPSAPLWGTSSWVAAAADMLRLDLAAAGIPYVVQGTNGPLFADFHALRRTYITGMLLSGVDLRTVQELAGHSSPVLTANYCQPRLAHLAGSVQKMPGFLPKEG